MVGARHPGSFSTASLATTLMVFTGLHMLRSAVLRLSDQCLFILVNMIESSRIFLKEFYPSVFAILEIKIEICKIFNSVKNDSIKSITSSRYFLKNKYFPKEN